MLRPKWPQPYTDDMQMYPPIYTHINRRLYHTPIEFFHRSSELSPDHAYTLLSA
jgi:hypothetical protein